jgi:ferritin
VCQNRKGLNQRKASLLAGYLITKGAKTCQEKEFHTFDFLQDFETKIEEDFCSEICNLKTICQRK